jgi:hypothetical protein
LDWAVITAIATVVGVIGGLVSVVFLMSFEKDVFALIANNAGLYLKGSAGLSKLTATQKLTFERIVNVQMSLFYSAYVQFQQRLIDDEVWDAYFDALNRYMKAPGFRESWKGFESSYPKSFRDMINGKLSVPAAS